MIKETKGREELCKYIFSLIFYSNISEVTSIDYQIPYHPHVSQGALGKANAILLLLFIVSLESSDVLTPKDTMDPALVF